MATKDFAPIESDYAFFMAHSTEAASDAALYARELAGFAADRSSIHLLDFGCGTGEFTERLLGALSWPPHLLQITLVERVPHQLEQAALRLASFSQRPIEITGDLPPADDPRFDLILSNHVLYYVEDLAAKLGQLIDLVQPGGKLLLAIAGWDNALLELWKFGFAILDRPVPYFAAEDVEAILSARKAKFRKSQSPYQLRFPNTQENRLKILRFLFSNYLQDITPERLLPEFGRYTRSGHIEINTHSYHFAIDRA